MWKQRAILKGMALTFAAVLTLAGCSDNSSDDGTAAVAAVTEPEDATSLLRVRLMTNEQYQKALANLFGEDIADSVVAPLPPLTRAEDGMLASNAASIGMTSDQLQQIQIAARTVSGLVVDQQHRDYLIPCTPEDAKAADQACAEQFLKTVGRLWFRRPVDKADLDVFVSAAGSAAEELEDFYEGLGLALEAMLVNPEGVYIVERAEPDPERPGKLRLDAYSLASRLSFFLWNSPPDSELLDAAANGKLDTEEGLLETVDAMLESPRLEDGVRSFFDDMMVFDEFDTLAKDAQVYPAVTGATLADAREQTLRTIYDQLIRKEIDYRDLFTSRETFMSMNLAAIYEVPAPDGWIPYTFPEDGPRQGLVTHVSFLAAHAHPAATSPTTRGRALRSVFLCQFVPDPPPSVDFSNLEDAGPGVHTARSRLSVHASNPDCAGCHKLMDPIGLALEHFDGAGRYRETDEGYPIDASGELDGTKYDDVEGLAQALSEHPELPSCLVDRLYSYGTGGPLAGRRDWPQLDYLKSEFARNGYRLPELMKTIIMSQAFSAVRKPRESAIEPGQAQPVMASASAEQTQ